MPRIVILLFVPALHLFDAALGEAAYLIRLKNGKEIVTSHYSKDDRHVKFFAYGGILTLEKSLISVIEPTDRAPREQETEPVSSAPATAQTPAAPPSSSEAAVKSEGAKEKPSGPAREETKKDEAIVQEFRELQQRFGQLNDLTTVEVYRLRDDFNFFKRTVLSSGLAEIHAAEIDGANTLVGAIDGWLKAKSGH